MSTQEKPSKFDTVWVEITPEQFEAQEKPPREWWLDIATPYGDPCDFISAKPHEHPSATNIHVIEYSAYESLRRERDELFADRKKFIQRTNELCAERDEARVLVDAKIKMGEEFLSDLEECERERDALKAEREQADADYAELLRERNKLKTQLAEMNKNCISLFLHEQRMSEAVAALETLKVAVNDKVEDKGATAFIERTLAKLRGVDL